MTSLAPGGFGDLVDRIGVEVRTTRLRAARAANTELVAMSVDRTTGRRADLQGRLVTLGA